jgi:capsule polysaccharide export protein KpsE/RkpR
MFIFEILIIFYLFYYLKFASPTHVSISFLEIKKNNLQINLMYL